MAFAEELHTSVPGRSESSARRGRRPCAAPAAKVASSEAQAEVDQNLHSR